MPALKSGTGGETPAARRKRLAEERRRKRARRSTAFNAAVNDPYIAQVEEAIQAAKVRDALEARGNRPGGPSPGRTASAARAKSRLPASEKRSAAGQTFTGHMDDPDWWKKSGGQATLDALHVIGLAGKGAVDIATGIPTLIEHPSLVNAAMVIPGLRPFRGAKAAARALGHGVDIPEAGSAVGRGIDRVYDAVISDKGKTRRAGKEIARTARNEQTVKSSQAKALDRLTSKLTLPEQVALRAVIEGTPIEERIALHAHEAAAATDAVTRRLHKIHVKALERARDLVHQGTDGKLYLSNGASKNLTEALRLDLASGGQREEILGRLGQLIDARASGRRGQPGQIYRGGRWTLKSLAETKRAWPGMWVRAADQSNFGKIISVEGDSALVHFFNKKQGVEADVRLPLSQLYDARKPAGHIVGGEGPDLSRGYVPYERGIPGTIRTNPIGYGVGMVRGRTRAIGGTLKDKNAIHEFTGALIRSGRFATDTTRVSAKAVMAALKLDAVDTLRKRLLENALPGPEARAAAGSDEMLLKDWQPIKQNPSKPLDDNARQLFEALEQNQALDPKLAEQYGDNLFAKLKDEVFPAATAARLDDPNILWVPRALYSGVFHQRWIEDIARGIRSVEHETPWARLPGEVWHGANDMLRLAYLYLNPSYYTLNFLGNTALGVIHQGIFLPANLKNAMRLHSKMASEDVLAIDGLVGHGYSRALGGQTGNVTKKIVGPIADWANTAIDLLPRRAAFFHEARKAGYVNHVQVTQLIRSARAGNSEALAKLDRIARKANDAMIDYDRLSPLERNLVSKVIFFYPWVKGSSRYTTRFALDHPYQAAMFAYLGYEYNQANNQLGGGPWYTQSIIEIPEGFPGAGKVTDLSPLAPFGTLPGLAQSAYGFATGDKNARPLMGEFNPIIEQVVGTLTGKGEFGQDLSLSERLGGELYNSIPWKRRVESFQESPEERADSIYPRTNEDLVTQMIGGRTAPAPYNAELAQDRVKSSDQKAAEDQEAEDKLADQLLNDEEYATLHDAWDKQAAFEQALDGVEGDEERARAAMDVLLSYMPEARPDAEEALSQMQTTADWNRLYRKVREILFERVTRIWGVARNQYVDDQERAVATG